jgi:type IV secretory pathway VirB2 component (pilin)
MRGSFAWALQVLGLVVVGSAFVFGLAYDRIRLELALAAVGAAAFLLGRWLGRRGAG